MIFIDKANYLVIALFCFVVNFSFGQDQRVADSLKIIYAEDKLKDTLKLELLNQLSFNELNDFNLSLKY